MKLAFIAEVDASQDVAAWSGTTYHLYHALARRTDVTPLIVPTGQLSALERGWLDLRRRLTGRTYKPGLHPRLLRDIGRAAGDAARAADADAALVVGQGYAVFWEAPVPVYVFSDTIYGSKIDFYSNWRRDRLPPRQLAELRWLATQSYSRMRHLFIMSRFATQQAERTLGVHLSTSKVTVTRIGANFDPTHAGWVERPAPPPLHLLWVGVNWQRKGGDDVVALMRTLRDRGLAVRLHIVGCEPPVDDPDIIVHGRLDKSDPVQMNQLLDLYRQAHLFVFPSRADMSSAVLAEAASTGLPGVTAPIGGITDLFESDQAIYLPLENFAEQAVPAILDLVQGDGWRDLGRRAHERYQSHLNWDTIAGNIVTTIEHDLMTHAKPN